MLTGAPTTPGQRLSFTTRSLVPADRATAWERALSKVLVDLEAVVEGGRPWAGELTAERLGALQITTEESGPCTILRSARSVAADPSTHILVRLQLDGSALLSQDGRTAELRPGRLAFHDARRPFRIVLPGPQRAWILMLPRALLRLQEGQLSALTATVLDDTEEGAAALLLPLLRGLLDEVTRTAAVPRRDDLARMAAEVLATLALEQVGSRPAPALWERITASADARLGDPELTPRDIADQHNISLRYLYRLFQAQGTTVNAWVRMRRLESAGAELARAGAAHRSIAAVAARWGFTNPSHFSRSFRDSFGVSPVQWRAAHLGTRGPAGAVPSTPGPRALSA
ncbi:helix-turn-helix domain-containing protein [Streptomyces qinzhouensis]|uniref:helix-turn-helix domain-containing protein n=1 Tax=Streptomyces qinzhouensis TaxID=2599401 RepID=UPI0016484914|nr:helix-turn-helix domain-containing protein [Streptomyces qinzhouensis]